MVDFSVFDLVNVAEGKSPADALRNAADLAQHAETWGYKRIWVAEHHNTDGVASAATSVVIGYLAGATTTIRVGAGGIMLPNHSPLVIAEQFGTLESLYPGRIDLGLGRAPGTDRQTIIALRRDEAAANRFPQDVIELQSLFGPVQPGQTIQAVPGANLDVPIWILGSSLYGAQLAAALGLPYAFASHFAPAALMEAFRHYRARFAPSLHLKTPYAMAGINVIVAETDAEAQRLFTSTQQFVIDIPRGIRGRVKPPIDDIAAYGSPSERAQAANVLMCSFVGSPKTVEQKLMAFVDRTKADELMVASIIFDHDARLRSYQFLAEIAARMSNSVAGRRQTPP